MATQSSRTAPGRGPDPRNADIRALLARSGNQCAFPRCGHLIVNARNQFIAQVCHIEAAAPGGPRYNDTMTDTERRSEANLLLLCYQHHVETSDPTLFSVSALREMKRTHESRFADQPYAAVDAAVANVSREIEQYWIAVDRANSVEHVMSELRIAIDSSATPEQLIGKLRQVLARLRNVHEGITRSANALPDDIRSAILAVGYDPSHWDEMPYWKNPAVARDWEYINLGLPNWMEHAEALLDQLEWKILERELEQSPANAALRSRIEGLRAAFLDGARYRSVID